MVLHFLCCTIGLKASLHLSLNQNQLWHVHTHFPFFTSTTCIYFLILLVQFILVVFSDWLERLPLLWFWFYDTQLKTMHSIDGTITTKCLVLYLRVTFFFQGSILDVIKNVEYCDVVNDEDMIIEHLRLLVNLSATNIAHDEIMTGAQEFFNILSQSLSGKVQVNWIVLAGNILSYRLKHKCY